MGKLRCFFTLVILFSQTLVFAQNGVQISIPKGSSKSSSAFQFTIGTRDDGIINGIKVVSQEGQTSNFPMELNRNGLSITESSDSAVRYSIRWDGNLITYTKEIPSQSKSVQRVASVQDSGVVIYEDESIVLKRTPIGSLSEDSKDPKSGILYRRYSNRVLDAFYKGFDNFRYQFLEKGGAVSVKPSSNLGDDNWISEGPPTVVTKIGKGLHSSSNVVNVVNYFVLQSYGLADWCFPELFLGTETYFGRYDDGKISGNATLSFEENKSSLRIEKEERTGKAVARDTPYELENAHPLQFINMAGDRWLLIPWPEGVFLSRKDGSYTFLTREAGKRTEPLKGAWTFDSSSFLKEKKNTYEPGNLGNPTGLPWASGNGLGVGDKITIKIGSTVLPMLLLNGYVSFDRPNLYNENSRLRRMRLTDKISGKSKEVEVEDKPEYQRFQLDDIASAGNTTDEITLEVLDVYKGTKFKDLCVKSILPDFSAAK